MDENNGGPRKTARAKPVTLEGFPPGSTGERLEYKPGDVFVIRVPVGMNSNQMTVLKKTWETTVIGTKAMILQGGAEAVKQ